MSRRSPEGLSSNSGRSGLGGRSTQKARGSRAERNGVADRRRNRKSLRERFSPQEMKGRIKDLNTPHTRRVGVLAVVLAVVFLLVLHATSGHNPPVTTTYATTFFRQSAAKHYGGTAKTGDSRGCARSTSSKWICTVTVERTGKPAVDVYGTVTSDNGKVETQAGLAQGSEFQDWLTKAGGGCRVRSCKGATIKS